jgi:hypothetical protein
VIDALGYVKPLAWGDGGSLLRQLEHGQRRFISCGLLSGDHVVERYLEAAGSVSEKVVIDIGDDRELVPGLQFLEGLDCVGKGQPVGEGLGKRTDLGVGRSKGEAFAQASKHGMKDFTVGMVISALGVGFEFGVEAEEF